MPSLRMVSFSFIMCMSRRIRMQLISIRTRSASGKLLLHRREIRKLIGKLHEKGIALIPLKIYFISNGKAKVELALARGKKLYDKRAALKEKESNREVERDLRRGE